ncbi:MAG: 2-C-methyl-D-erythritol 2,4-cyclodiphosphate synthase [bacterium]|nr:2-C-methyl-D-erythritol 2,4-cyclodiphosphate synthase [bacterium]
MNFRVGQGWDRHPLQKGRRCILGGVHFEESPVGPLGHSDGDAMVHALIDALLGAAGLGDIGEHFPDTDSRYSGVDSLDLLTVAWKTVTEKGFTFGNADCTIICEQPKISPRKSAMREKMATVLGIDSELINIKATRGEGLGPEGRGECVTALATVLLSTGKIS